MEQETRDDYTSFYYYLKKASSKVNNIRNSIGEFRAKDRTELVKVYYLSLKEKKVEDIEHLRGCLNTLEKELGMEVTE